MNKLAWALTGHNRTTPLEEHELEAVMTDAFMPDVKYKIAIDKKKSEKLKAGLHLIGEQPVKQHKIFVTSEQEKETFDPVQHFNTTEEFKGRSFNRFRKDQIESGKVLMNQEQITPKVFEKVKASAKRSYNELNARIQRTKKIKNSIKRLQLEKQLAQKGSKRKVEEDSSGIPIYKWKRQRSK